MIDAIGNNEIGRGKVGANETNLSNSFISNKSIRAGYLIFKSTKKGGGNSNSSGSNTKKGVKAAKGSNYLTQGAKKTFNLLRHAFI